MEILLNYCITFEVFVDDLSSLEDFRAQLLSAGIRCVIEEPDQLRHLDAVDSGGRQDVSYARLTAVDMGRRPDKSEFDAIVNAIVNASQGELSLNDRRHPTAK